MGKALATALTVRGFATARFGKVTAETSRHVRSESLTLADEYLTDAGHCLETLVERHPLGGPLVVLGHSLGGFVVWKLAELSRFDGVVLMGAPVVPPEFLIHQQLERLRLVSPDAADDIERMQSTLATQLTNLAAVRTGHPPAGPLPFGLSAAYWAAMDSIRPLDAARSLAKPVLVMRGAEDNVISDAVSAAAWETLRPAPDWLTVVRYAGLGHLMADQPNGSHAWGIAAEPVDDLTRWCRALGVPGANNDIRWPL